jgi:hypothetical protein
MMTLPTSALALVFALFVSSACSESTSSGSPFSGRWEGGNASYPSVTLVVQQLGDSLSGTAEVTFDFPGVSGHLGPTTLVGHVYGDSLSVLWRVPPTSGYLNMQFAGHRSGVVLVGNINNSARILLTKQ